MNKPSSSLTKITAAILIFGISGIANSELIYQYVNKGTFAYLAGDGYNNGNSLNVQVVQHGIGPDQNTNLIYFVHGPIGWKFWSGSIPNSALIGAGTSTLTLNVNTCEINPSSYCGVLNITWKTDGRYSTYSSGLRKVQTGDITVQTHGTRTYKSSSTSGSVIGFNVSQLLHIYSTIGTDHNVTHSIYKGN